MRILLKKVYQSPNQYGQKKLTIYISQAFRQTPNVYFEIFEKDREWTVCWIMDITWMEAIIVSREMNLTEDEWHEALDDTAGENRFIDVLRERNPIRSHCVDQKTAKQMEALCKEGLPKPKSYPQGLDGHDYSITIDGFPKTFSCWCALPKEWKKLKPIINQCIAYAQLDPDEYGTS